MSEPGEKKKGFSTAYGGGTTSHPANKIASDYSDNGGRISLSKHSGSRKHVTEDVPFLYCKKCGRKLRAGEKCPTCYPKPVTLVDGEAPIKKNPKVWLVMSSIAAILVLVIGLISAIPQKSTNTAALSANQDGTTYEQPTNTAAPSANQDGTTYEQPSNSNSDNQTTVYQSDPLSATCDFVLCVGNDKAGNTYELVANQTESSRGFEISVGVIKNNTWLYPLSSSFPFLAEDGLFHVDVSMAGESGTSLKYGGNSVIDNLYFIDSGAFLLDCYKANDSLSLYDHYYIVFSCNTLTSTRIDCDESTLLYRYSEPEFMSGQVENYGQIYTDDGNLIMYTETSGTWSGWTEDQVFKWDLFNTRSLTFTTIASDIHGIRPRGVLSEGVFFCTDARFYNTNGQPTVDLTDYGIDVWDSGNIFFEDGTCTFEVKNSIGTRFFITIDSSGALIREQQA